MRSWARTARARPRCPTSSPGSTGPTRGASRSSGNRWSSIRHVMRSMQGLRWCISTSGSCLRSRSLRTSCSAITATSAEPSSYARGRSSGAWPTSRDGTASPWSRARGSGSSRSANSSGSRSSRRSTRMPASSYSTSRLRCSRRRKQMHSSRRSARWRTTAARSFSSRTSSTR